MKTLTCCLTLDNQTFPTEKRKSSKSNIHLYNQDVVNEDAQKDGDHMWSVAEICWWTASRGIQSETHVQSNGCNISSLTNKSVTKSLKETTF